jgi:hypothetical protein
MPIRFRCLYCDQFLGISRAKAGQVVDCPQCGRSIRVPARDGRAEAVSAPRFDLADPHLAQAMDALAVLHQPEAPAEIGPADDADAPRPGEPAAQIRVADVSAVPVVIVVPPLSAPAVREAQPPHEPTRGPRMPVDLVERADPNAYSEEIARLARQADEAAVRRESSEPPRAGGWRVLLMPAVLVSIAAAALAGFAIGFVTAPRGEPAASNNTAPVAAGKSVSERTREGGAETDAADDGAADRPAGVVLPGRVTYEAAGTTRPDTQARVLALPERREGTLLLPALSLLQSPGGPDWRIGAEGLRIAGGQVALAGADGEFELPLPAPGRYWLVILSGHQSRDPERAVEPAVLGLLGGYFDRPLLLVGKRAYHVRSVLASGDEAPVIRHRFPEDG